MRRELPIASIRNTIHQIWASHEAEIEEAMAAGNELEALVLKRELADARWLKAELIRRLKLELGDQNAEKSDDTGEDPA